VRRQPAKKPLRFPKCEVIFAGLLYRKSLGGFLQAAGAFLFLETKLHAKLRSRKEQSGLFFAALRLCVSAFDLKRH